MNKRLLTIAAVMTALILLLMGGVMARVLDKHASDTFTANTSWSQSVLHQLGIKTKAEMNAQTQSPFAPTNTSTNTPTNAPVIAPSSATSNHPISSTVQASAEYVKPASVVVNAPTAPASGIISAQQASLVAQRAAPNARVASAPELVRYAGKVAYEVVMNTGNVYIDANTGAVLDNAAVSAPAQQNEDDEGEHEGKNKRRHHEEEDDDEDEHEYRRG